MQATPRRNLALVDLGAQYTRIAGEISRAIAEVLCSGDFILGRKLEEFEEEFARYCGARYAIGVDSGTSALELALRAFGVGPGDEVITAANTFIATALAISHSAAKPVLVDVDPQTYTIDPSAVRSALTARTKAVIAVHLYGHPADMDPILDIARRHGLVVIEDACQAHGAKYKGFRVGSLGHAAAFSFYPAKNLGAYGDGGIVVTSDPQTADAVRLLRNYGQRVKYEHQCVGFNRRLDTLQAAVLAVKLKYLDEWNALRSKHARRYKQLLAGTGVITPAEADYAQSVWHLYVIRTKNRELLRRLLSDQGIATGVHYPVPIHLQAAYRELGCGQGDFPVTENFADEILSLPMYAELPAEAIEYVSDCIREFHTRVRTNVAAVA
jgi:dTDP-4-amino-4,6-dideoxygalactose transaminase